MADAPPPAAFTPYRDSVDESAPLIPGDAEAGLAGAPADPGALDSSSRRLDIRSVTIASKVLLLASVVVLLLDGAVIITNLFGDNVYESFYRLEDGMYAIGTFVSPPVHPVCLTRIGPSRPTLPCKSRSGPYSVFPSTAA
ncbi:hypothetical protein IMZ48_17280 [Candidatus Bathyarchaeota archaeon]|nr:hypothetical protein [Candidatus Bathyarchaeota archaeon]